MLGAILALFLWGNIVILSLDNQALYMLYFFSDNIAILPLDNQALDMLYFFGDNIVVSTRINIDAIFAKGILYHLQFIGSESS